MIALPVFRTLHKDTSGATLVEFALVAPVLILMLMGVFDLAHTQYTSTMVNGAMQKAGRDLTLESSGSQVSAIDEKVINAVKTVAPESATVELEKMSHYEFSDIDEAEEFADDNNDGVCNDGEAFVDANNNGHWDTDRGEAGLGGARDALVYTAVVKYDRLFPMYGLAGFPQEVEIRATTVLRNQPYDVQDTTVSTGNCL